MKKGLFYWKVICIVWLILITGCDNGEQEELTAALTASGDKVIALKTENQELKKKNHDLSNRLLKTQAEYENAKIQQQQSEVWSRELVQIFGPCVWYYSPHDKPFPHERLREASPQQLMAKLNLLFKQSDSPEATLMAVEKGIAHVKIMNATQLTQSMGTEGAASYMNAVIYTLCSVDAVQCVDFDFAAGDHAFPGSYCQ